MYLMPDLCHRAADQTGRQKDRLYFLVEFIHVYIVRLHYNRSRFHEALAPY